MSKYFMPAVLAAFAVASPAAFAEAVDPTGLYVGLGYERLNVDAGNTDFNFDTALAQVGYRFNPYLGVEGEVGRVLADDKVTLNGTEFKAQIDWTAGAYAVGYLPIGNFDVVARAGYKEMSVDLKSNIAGVKAQGGGLAWSLGGQYFFADHHGVRLNYTQDTGVKGVNVSYLLRF